MKDLRDKYAIELAARISDINKIGVLKLQQFQLNWEQRRLTLPMFFRSAQNLGAGKIANTLHIWRRIVDAESGTRLRGLIQLKNIAMKKCPLEMIIMTTKETKEIETGSLNQMQLSVYSLKLKIRLIHHAGAH
jgi:hypothetical protein